MASKQTNTFREEIENIIDSVVCSNEREWNLRSRKQANENMIALFQKVVDKACNENDVTYYYFGPRDYEMAKMNVIETKKRIRASFKDIVEGKESI